MKNKILPFIIRVLIGAILATGGFFIYENAKGTDNQTVNSFENRRQMKAPEGDFDGQTPPDMQNGENSSDSNSSTRPTRPDKTNSKTTTESNT